MISKTQRKVRFRKTARGHANRNRKNESKGGQPLTDTAPDETLTKNSNNENEIIPKT